MDVQMTRLTRKLWRHVWMVGALTLGLAAEAYADGGLSKVAGYATGYSDQEGGVAEIVSYNPDNRKAYLVNGREKKIDVVSLDGITGTGNTELKLEKRVDVGGMIEGFRFGDVTSVAVNTKKELVAVAVQAEAYEEAGAILLLDYDGNKKAHYQAGVQPDMVTFTPDGRYVLSANEGEPRKGYGEGAVDPEGSVTVVDLDAQSPVSRTVGFASWDGKRDSLTAKHVLLKKGNLPSKDLEPEYIAASSDGKTAYVALQEANAIATLNLEAGAFTDISSLGFKDHKVQGNGLDALKDGKANIQNQNLYGVYMPDGISIYEKGGKTYILGGRSFSIYEVAGEGIKQVFDSGSDFERITAERYPDYFNASNKNNKLDSRSDAKGPEPESVVVGTVGDKTYAYIGLERIGGVMAYDITTPEKAVFMEYINSRSFGTDFPEQGTDPAQGDISVEGIATVPAVQSPTGSPLILTANEVSGTLAVYQQK